MSAAHSRCLAATPAMSASSSRTSSNGVRSKGRPHPGRGTGGVVVEVHGQQLGTEVVVEGSAQAIDGES